VLPYCSNNAHFYSIFRGFEAPTFQAFGVYFLLFFTHGGILFYQRRGEKLCEFSLWKYFLVAFIDVEANFLVCFCFGGKTTLDLFLSRQIFDFFGGKTRVFWVVVLAGK